MASLRLERVRAGSPLEPVWTAMRRKLWPSLPEDLNRKEAPEWLAREDAVTLLCVDESGAALGFVEAGERSYGEGCDTSPVGYIEGWYVEPQARGRGVGRLLVEAAEEWARRRGLTEMGSDAEIDNSASHRAHQRLGYEETDRLVCFRKALL